MHWHGNSRSPRGVGQQVRIELIVAILEERRLAPVTPLGDVVRNPRNNGTGQAGHGAQYAI